MGWDGMSGEFNDETRQWIRTVDLVTREPASCSSWSMVGWMNGSLDLTVGRLSNFYLEI